VLPIGGLKDKALAALRAGITKVLIPDENQKDLVEIPEELRKKITFFPVKHMDEVIELTLGKISKLGRHQRQVAGKEEK
jgi:ATP-dependent Lon protease